MMRPQALMEAVSADLNWFLRAIGENLTKPPNKFLGDALVGLFRSRPPRLSPAVKRTGPGACWRPGADFVLERGKSSNAVCDDATTGPPLRL